MTATTTQSSTATQTASKNKKTKSEAKSTETKTTANAQPTARLFYDHVESPLGPFTVVADSDGRLVAAGWTDDATDGRMAGRLRIFASRCDAEFVRASNPGGLSAALDRLLRRRPGGDREIAGLRIRRHTVPALGLARAARDPVRRKPILR